MFPFIFLSYIIASTATTSPSQSRRRQICCPDQDFKIGRFQDAESQKLFCTPDDAHTNPSQHPGEICPIDPSATVRTYREFFNSLELLAPTPEDENARQAIFNLLDNFSQKQCPAPPLIIESCKTGLDMVHSIPHIMIGISHQHDATGIDFVDRQYHLELQTLFYNLHNTCTEWNIKIREKLRTDNPAAKTNTRKILVILEQTELKKGDFISEMKKQFTNLKFFAADSSLEFKRIPHHRSHSNDYILALRRAMGHRNIGMLQKTNLRIDQNIIGVVVLHGSGHLRFYEDSAQFDDQQPSFALSDRNQTSHPPISAPKIERRFLKRPQHPAKGPPKHHTVHQPQHGPKKRRR